MNTTPLKHADFAVSATMSDPAYTDQGAIFPMIQLSPDRDSTVLTLISPDQENASVALTDHELMSLRDQLDQILSFRGLGILI